MIEHLLFFDVLRIRYDLFVLLNSQGLFAEHGDRQTARNLEDIDIIHNLQGAVDVVGEAVKLAALSTYD